MVRLGISLSTLINKFRHELNVGRSVRICENLALLRRYALKGNISAARALMVAYAAPPDHYGQTAMGKKERREWEAKNAIKGTVWEDVLREPETAEAMNGQ
jgi:hypothetical protein